MKEQIKELRVRIDGISQLVKGLNPVKWIIDMSCIPKGMGVTEFMNLLQSEGSPLIPSNDVEKIKPIEQRELSKCYDSLILAKAWLGKILGELGEETPYKNDGNRKTVEDIEEPADTVKKGLKDKTAVNWFDNGVEVFKNTQWAEKNYIEKIDWLRETIGKIVNKIIEIVVLPSEYSREFAIARTNSFTHLSEARFWLGFELQRLKETNSKDNGN